MKLNQLLSGFALVVLIILFFTFPVRGHFFYESKSGLDSKPNSNGILDTFSLSFVGNFNFSNAVEIIHRIFETISNFLDLKVIHAAVDVALDRFFPSKKVTNPINDIHGPISRIDVDVGNDEYQKTQNLKKNLLKDEITTVVGAVLNKQNCWNKMACVFGRRTKSFAAKDVFFVMAEKLVPNWKDTIDVVRSGAHEIYNCQEFQCTPENTENY